MEDFVVKQDKNYADNVATEVPEKPAIGNAKCKKEEVKIIEKVMANLEEEEKKEAKKLKQYGFKKYSSIENTYNTKFVKSLIEAGLDKEEWVVLEKVHGANFSFLVEEGTENSELRVICAKRTNILKMEDKFFNFQSVFRKYEDSCKRLFKRVRELRPDRSIKKILIFGELFGGYYPDQSVSDSVCIQKEILYCPHNDFIIFDIHDGTSFLDHDIILKLAEEVGMIALKVLYRGSFQSVLDYHESFITTIPEYFHLPPLKDNMAEGVILKPVVEKFILSHQRAILKKKNPKFLEVKKKQARPAVVSTPSKNHEQMVELVNSYVNCNRLHNVISKFGEVDERCQDLGKLTGWLAKDSLDELKKLEGKFVESLPKDDQKKLSRMAAEKSRKVVLDNIKDLAHTTTS
eukprot:TRINITY_DN3415_c0_g1_i1.p1 TRINITY_DN3415_c0_g1~~TRINITY_DN3415_c0_g1_i1.p1  ORF type:complete len:404 (+),score=105.63 TRINITY_DN3415_c0_g1_i1:90-1301(+)